MNKVSIHTLKSGVRVILAPNKNAYTTSVFVGVPVGSVHEEDNQHGLAHFFEHMCFQGTKSYPHYKLLLDKIASLGLIFNAFTGNEQTAYYLSGASGHTKEMLQIVSDMCINSLFPAEELEKEKGVIVQEIKMYEDDGDSRSSEEVEQQLFISTPLGHPILGTKKEVESYSRDDFLKFYNKHYVAENLVVSVAGNFDSDAVLSELELLFANVSHGTHTEFPTISPTRDADTQLKSILKKENAQMNIALGFYAPGAHDKESVASEVFSTILGGGLSSRLGVSIREEMGACYRIGSCYLPLSNVGIFYISTGTEPHRAEEVLNAIAIECKKLKNELVDEVELAKAKNTLEGKLLYSAEHSSGVAQNYLLQFLEKGKCKTIEEQILEIQKVTSEEIGIVAEKILKGSEVRVGIVGNRTVEKDAITPLTDI